MRAIDPSLFVLGVVLATTLLLYKMARRRAPVGRGVRAAFNCVLEWAGLTVILFALNILAGFLAVLALRRLTGGFVSLYLAADVSLLMLSAVQAVACQGWMRRRDEPSKTVDI